MATGVSFGRDRPVAQLALRGERRRVVQDWLESELLRFTTINPSVSSLGGTEVPIGSEPVIIDLPLGSGIDDRERVAVLTALTERAPIIAIVDTDMVDVLAPFLEIDRAEFVAWPCGKEMFMSVLQKIGAPTLRERHDSGAVNADVLRDEIERIARALSALVDGAASPAPAGTPSSRPPAESVRILRSIIRRRRARAQFFPADLFADPAWDILLDLAAARLERAQVSISSLCIAAAVPTTTALRWIKGMTAAGILERDADPGDGRRSFVRLSDRAAAAMESYLSMIDEGVV